MKIKNISVAEPWLPTKVQILKNRGINSDFEEYIKAVEQPYIENINKYVSPPELLGEDKLKKSVDIILNSIESKKKAFLIVDCDTDGMTSAALFLNYFHIIYPDWVENYIDIYMHEGKQHGLNDIIDKLDKDIYNLSICIDSSTNDIEAHKILKENDIDIIVLDHHLQDVESKDAIIINNQICDYPNKELSGVGIAWQFCRYFDKLYNKNYANDFLDLVAIGCQADMMSLKSLETRFLISLGLRHDHIQNAFIETMINKNTFSLSKSDYQSSVAGQSCTPIGASFFIIPFLNATTRSGTMEEKELIFNSMLAYKAFKKIKSNKRGAKKDDMEYLVNQAVRTIINIKNRQTRYENAGLDILNKQIENNNMKDHKVLMFILEPGEIDGGIRGLCANKMMAKYQRSCMVLTKTPNGYEGSCRGYTKTGVENFKEICENSGLTEMCAGHQSAFGTCTKSPAELLDYLDNELKDIGSDIVHRVDFELKYTMNKEMTREIILDIADMNDYWGQDVDRAYVSIEFKVTKDNFAIMKSNTLKIDLGDISIIKFGGSEEDIDNFTTEGEVRVKAICKCGKNEWNGNTYAQLILEDYEILENVQWIF